MTNSRIDISRIILAVLAAMMMLVPFDAAAEPTATEPVYYDSNHSNGELSGGRVEVPLESAECSSEAGIMVSANASVVSDKGSSANRVDVVFVGDGYAANEIGAFSSHITQVSSGFFLQAPFYEYANYFNLHRVDAVSSESGIDHDPAYGTLKNTALDSQYWCQGTASTLCTNVSKAWEYANLARGVDQIVVLVNSSSTGGAAYPFSDLAIVSPTQVRAADSFLHQFGHSFGNLADEYDTGSWPEYTGFEPFEPNVSAQNSASMTSQQLKWHRWLGTNPGSQYGGLIDTYEGAMGHQTKIYRSTTDSKMRTLTAPFNAVSAEAIIGQIYRLVSPIDGATPANAQLVGRDTISVTPLQPVGRDLKIQWYMNGNAVQGATGKTFRPNDYPFADGTYTASVTVTDDTNLMRDEDFRTQYMTASRSWTVAVDQNPPIIVSSPESKTVFVGQSATFSVIAQGEDLRYQWYKGAAPIAGATSASYTTPAAARADSGSTYKVRVSNVAGYVDSAAATLTVGNRLPILPTIGTIPMVRNQTLKQNVTALDVDGDTVTLSVSVVPQTPAPGAQVSLDGSQISITTNASFLGDFQIKVTASDGYDSVSMQFTVSVANQGPGIAPIPAQNIHWKTDSIVVTINASDNDNDVLTYSAALTPPGSAPATLSLAGNKLTINPDSAYLGTFNVSVTVSDSRTSSSTTFSVNVFDNAPVIQPINDQSMYFKNDFLNVPISASDPDGETLTYSASLSGSTPPVVLSFTGSTLKINPATDYIGKFNVKVDVSDGKKTSTATFAVDVYNSRPTLTPIPDQRMHYKVDSITVPVVAVDNDGEELTYSAELAQGELAPVTVTMNNRDIVINPAQDYIGSFRVKVRVADSTSFVEQTFRVTAYNNPPIIQPIPDQRIHWKVDKRVVGISVTDQDGDEIELEAKLIGTVTPEPEITVDGNDITIDPADGFLGSFAIKVTASDGIDFDSRSFGVITYNSPPDLKPICDRSVSESNLPLDVTLVATDDDIDVEALTYSAFAEKTNVIYDLDQKYNFEYTTDTWHYFNIAGTNEKYLRGSNDAWYALYPNGELYLTKFVNNAIAKDTLIFSLPVGFYHDPSMLVDVAQQLTDPPVTLTVEGDVLTIDAPAGYRGTFAVRARASDAQLFDEESFLVTIYNPNIQLDPIADAFIHWRQEPRLLTLNARTSDGAVPSQAIQYSIQVADNAEIRALDATYNFHSPAVPERRQYAADNASGNNERYIIGGNGNQDVFAILPNGALYKCDGTWVSANVWPNNYFKSTAQYSNSCTFITKLRPEYYRSPSLLRNPVPAGDVPPVVMSITGNSLHIAPEHGFLGEYVLIVTATDGTSTDVRRIVVKAYNSLPDLDMKPWGYYPPNQASGISWPTRNFGVPFETVDADSFDSSHIQYSIRLGTTNLEAYELDQTHNFFVASGGTRYNEGGWRERHIGGYIAGTAVDFAVFPNGDLVEWKGNKADSALVTKVPLRYYERPEALVNVSNFPNDKRALSVTSASMSSDGTMSVQRELLNEEMRFVVTVSDGNMTDYYDKVVYVSGCGITFDPRAVPPEYLPVVLPKMHWRTDKIDVSITSKTGYNEPFTVTPSTTPNPGALALEYKNFNTLTVDPQPQLLGKHELSLRGFSPDTAEYAGCSTTERYIAEVIDTAPVLNPIGARTASSQRPYTFTVGGSDPDTADQPHLTYAARLGSYSHLAYQLDQQWNFTWKTAGNYELNARGYNERYIRGTKNGVTKDLVILPSGALYEWSGSFPLTQKIAQFPTNYHSNPALFLFDVANPGVLPPGVSLSMSDTSITVNPGAAKYSGTLPVTVEISDGNLLGAETFTLEFKNNAPVIQGVPNQQLGWRETFTRQLGISDPDGDTLTVSAAPAAGSTSLINVSLTAGHLLTVTPKTPFVGSAQVTITAYDGMATTTLTFSITYSNRAPTLNAIPNQTIKWNEKSRSLALVASDPDNDPLTYMAAVTLNPNAATVSITGTTLKFTLTNFISYFYVTAYVRDGTTTVSQTFRVDVTNVAPIISTIPAQKIHWRTASHSVPVTVSDADSDVPTMSAKLAAGSSHPVQISYVNGQVVMNFTQQTTGSFNVEVSAVDLLVTTKSTFLVTVGNTAPTIEDISDQVMALDVPSITVTAEGTDADSDPLTYSAQVLNVNQYAYALDQAHNFELRFGDYYFNKLGNNEKYIQGTKNSNSLFWYVIYPNGRFYEWSGQLTTSTYLSTLPVEYYTDPSKLFNVPSPAAGTAPAQVSVSGATITVTPSSDYTGLFWVRATVSDTKASAATYFSVLRQEVATGDEDGDDNGGGGQCKITTKTLSGDYNCTGTTKFVAEGRIGDSATGAGNRTHEIAVSRGNGSYSTGEKSNYVWRNNAKVPFKLIYDPQTQSAQFIVDNISVNRVTGVISSMTDIFIRAKSNKSSSVLLEQITLNGQSINKTVGASKSMGTTNVLQIMTGGLNDRFVLEGKVTMQFSGNTIKDSDLSFQITLSSIGGHSTTCVDPNNGHKVTICHMPPGNPSNWQTLRVSPSAVPAHLAHGDVIGECPGAPNDPGDGGGTTCEHKQIIASPNYTLWNSFLGMLDILELTNPSNADMPVKISFYSIHGALAHQITVTVPAMNQFDVIINDFPGFVRDSYGVVKLEFNGPLDGRMMYYRTSADGTGYDFAFDMPLSDPNFGRTAVGFNTFQPSQSPAERNNLVANWLSVVNLDARSQGYTISTYDTTGNLLLVRSIEVPPFGRADIDGGHDLAGPSVVGIHIIEPAEVTAAYLAQVTRFGGDAPAGFAPSKYKFAFPLSAKLGQSDPIYAPISSKLNEYNWLEVVNILDHPVGASINFYARDGRLLESLDATINAHAQLHFNATDYLDNLETGYASIVPREPFSIIAQSMGYLREPVAGGITAVYGSQARRALPCVQSGSYNLFLGMKNYLLVANTTNNTIEATVQITGPSLMAEKSLTLAPRASVYLPIHDPTQFGARPDTYGLIAVRPRDTTLRLFAEVMRVRYRTNGAPDFAAPTPVR